MIRLIVKDLRELWAAPAALALAIIWSCAVLAFSASLPLPERALSIAIAEPGGCVPGEEDRRCPFPHVATLRHVIEDLPGANFAGLETGLVDAYATMDAQQLDIVFAWHPTYYGLEDVFEGNYDLDFTDVESEGVWVAYTHPATRARTAQIRFAIRQVQASALNIENARAAGRAPILPTLGLADLVSEAGPLVAAAMQADAYEAYIPPPPPAPGSGPEYLDDETWLALSDAIDMRLAEYEIAFGAPLPPDTASIVRDTFLLVAETTRSVPDQVFADALLNTLDDVYGDAAALGIFEEQALYFSGAANIQYPAEIEPEPEPAELFTPFQATPVLVVERDGPARASSAWLVPGLILIIASALAFMFTAAATVREREHGTEHLLFAGARRRRPDVLLAKTVAPSILAAVAVAAMMVFAQGLLGFEIKPGLPAALGSVALVIATAALQGLVAGSILRSQASALAVSGAYVITLLLLGGVFIPVEASGPPVAWIAALLPVDAPGQTWFDWFTTGAAIRLSELFSGLTLLAGSLAAAILAVEFRSRLT